jgi:hypothetical protein
MQDAIRAGVLPSTITPEEFMSSPSLQQRTERWHINDIIERIERGGLMQYVGRSIQGVEVTVPGMIAAAHLGGYGGLERLLRTGQARSDAYGTSTLDYLRRHGNPGAAPASPMVPSDLQPTASQQALARGVVGSGIGDMPEGIQAAVQASTEATGPISTTAVEQLPTRSPSVEEARPTARQEGRRTPLRVPREITALIDNLTNNERQDIIEYLRSLEDGE